MTSNNNQLDAWTDAGDAQQQPNAIPAGTSNANIMPNIDQHTMSSGYLVAPLTIQSNASINANHQSHSNNNLPIILNSNNDSNDNSDFGTATRLRTKFKNFKKFFSKN